MVSWGFLDSGERIAGQSSLGRIPEMSDLWPLCRLLTCGELFRGCCRSSLEWLLRLLFHTARFFVSKTSALQDVRESGRENASENH